MLSHETQEDNQSMKKSHFHIKKWEILFIFEKWRKLQLLLGHV